jgi:hydrogenase maturation protease
MGLDQRIPAYLTGASRSVVVFACGDPLRGDDALAFQACTTLPPDALARAEVRLVGALQPEYLRDLPPGVRAVIVDAVLGPAPGSLVQIELVELSGRAQPVVTTSSHQLPLDQVVALAQLLRDEPVEGRFVGVAVASVSAGEGLTPPVAGAVPQLRAAVARAIVELGQQSPAD